MKTGSLTYFISGHMDLTPAEFDEHYAPKIREAAMRSHNRFVVGDAPGCDAMAQRFLMDLDVGQDERERAEFHVYHMLSQPRNCVEGLSPVELRGGFASDAERDAAMTEASDEDIAWVRPDKKKRRSGTAKNLDRRREKNERLFKEERATWARVDLRIDLCDDGEVRATIVGPEEAAIYATDRAVPIPPGLKERLDAACAQLSEAQRAYWVVQSELKRAARDKEIYDD